MKPGQRAASFVSVGTASTSSHCRAKSSSIDAARGSASISRAAASTPAASSSRPWSARASSGASGTLLHSAAARRPATSDPVSLATSPVPSPASTRYRKRGESSTASTPKRRPMSASRACTVAAWSASSRAFSSSGSVPWKARRARLTRKAVMHAPSVVVPQPVTSAKWATTESAICSAVATYSSTASALTVDPTLVSNPIVTPVFSSGTKAFAGSVVTPNSARTALSYSTREMRRRGAGAAVGPSQRPAARNASPSAMSGVPSASPAGAGARELLADEHAATPTALPTSTIRLSPEAKHCSHLPTPARSPGKLPSPTRRVPARPRQAQTHAPRVSYPPQVTASLQRRLLLAVLAALLLLATGCNVVAMKQAGIERALRDAGMAPADVRLGPDTIRLLVRGPRAHRRPAPRVRRLRHVALVPAGRGPGAGPPRHPAGFCSGSATPGPTRGSSASTTRSARSRRCSTAWASARSRSRASPTAGWSRTSWPTTAPRWCTTW